MKSLKKLFLSLLALLALTSGAFACDGVVPKAKVSSDAVYIDKGACPFECCTYGTWKPKKKTPLYASITSKTVVGVASVGQKVTAVTGEVHTIPTVIEFTETAKDYTAGSRGEILTELGEGFVKFRYNGQISHRDDLLCYLQGALNPEEGEAQMQDCLKWEGMAKAKIIKKGHSDWWVKIKLPDGTTGWTKEDDNFDIPYGC